MQNVFVDALMIFVDNDTSHLKMATSKITAHKKKTAQKIKPVRVILDFNFVLMASLYFAAV